MKHRQAVTVVRALKRKTQKEPGRSLQGIGRLRKKAAKATPKARSAKPLLLLPGLNSLQSLVLKFLALSLILVYASVDDLISFAVITILKKSLNL